MTDIEEEIRWRQAHTRKEHAIGDRTWLLGEVDRLRAALLKAVGDAVDNEHRLQDRIKDLETEMTEVQDDLSDVTFERDRVIDDIDLLTKENDQLRAALPKTYVAEPEAHRHG